jgi:hypothetical protein
LRGRLTAGRLALDQEVGVRIPAPQPQEAAGNNGFLFSKAATLSPGSRSHLCLFAPSRDRYGLILGYLIYKSGLVPRRMAWFGLIGGPLLLFGNLGVVFDWWDQSGAVNILVVPEFIWGGIPRHLLRDLGIQAGLANPHACPTRCCRDLTVRLGRGGACNTS